MDILRKQDLMNLINRPKGWSASIFLPAEKVNPDLDKHRIRLKNALRVVYRQLVELGMRTVDARQFIAPAERLEEDIDYWQHQSQGLALFLSAEGLLDYRLPIRFTKTVVVKRGFYIKPLLPLLSRGNLFYILALSQNDVRLFEATIDTIDELEIKDVPSSLAEALWADDPEKQLQFHTATRGPGGKGDRPAAFHGQGVGINDQDQILLRYFQKVDAGLQPFLSEQRIPLIVAGVDYLHPIYRQANSYAHLMPEGISGNPDEWSGEELHAQALPIIKPAFGKELKDNRARFKQLYGQESPLSAIDISDIVRAAYNQRVGTLFVALRLQEWGDFDPETQIVTLRQAAGADSQELLDFSAVHTLLNDGDVYALKPDRMPVKSAAAAILRY